MEAWLEAIEAGVIASTATARDCVDVGAFKVMLDPNSDMVYLNYAVPTSEDFSPSHIEAMIQSFQRRDRTPRLEFTKELWPSLPAALAASGFELEAEQPTMMCSKADFRPFTGSGPEARLLGPQDDIALMFKVGGEAFGMELEFSPEKLETYRTEMRLGTLLYAGVWVDGEPAGCACLSPTGAIGELAGVGTRPKFRRQGVASAASTILMAEHFQRGDAVWLSAGDAIAKAVYERLGFAEVGTRVNYILPGA